VFILNRLKLSCFLLAKGEHFVMGLKNATNSVYIFTNRFITSCQRVSEFSAIFRGTIYYSKVLKARTYFNLYAPRFLYIGQAFCYSPENAFCIFNQQIYFIMRYLLDRPSLIQII